MPDLKELLRPASDTHSVKEAAIALFIAAPIIKPERFKDLIQKEFKDFYQKFEPVNRVALKFKGAEAGVESFPAEIQENAGFRFLKFKEGKLVNALQGMNEEGRQFISFHSLNYKDWESEFYPDFKNSISILSVFHPNIFVNALSLHYIDEFIWESENDVDLNKIFNDKSSLLPKEFFESKLDSYIFTTVKNNKYEYLDRLEIKVEKRQKTFVIISHNVIENLKDNFLLNDIIADDRIKERLDLAHMHNKKTLISLLRNEVCDLIHLKQ